MFHVRRRPADCAPRKRKKKPLSASARDIRNDSAPVLVELGPDGSAPIPGDTSRTVRLSGDVMEVGSANGIGLQLYGPHIQPRHCVITNGTDGVTSITPCHPDAHTYVNGQRIQHSTVLQHGNLVKFGHSNTYRFLDPTHEERNRPNYDNGRMYESRSPRALSPTENSRDNIETTFDLDGNVETVSTASGARDDNRSLGSSSENRLSGYGDRYNASSTSVRSTCGQDPILPAVLEFPEEPQEQFLARVITHLDVTTPTFRLAPAYTLYLCARYRASTHYRPELTPTERAHKLTVLLQHAAALVRHTVQDRSTESTSQAFWLANASEILHFLKSDRHVSAFSLQAQDTLADAVQLAFKNLVACLTDELNAAMTYLMSPTGDDHPREVINILSVSMNLLRKCRVNAALTIQLFSQLFHWISAKALTTVISNSNLCTRAFGTKLYNRLRNLQAWAESQGLELAAECHLAKIVQCAHLLQAPKYVPEDLANLSAVCFKLNSMQLGALLMQYKAEPGEQIAPPSLLEQAAKAAESVADELLRAEGRAVALYEDPTLPCHLLLPDDGYSCDVVHGVPPGLADFLQPLQASGLCRLAAQPTSSGQWTVYMNTANRPASAMSTTQPEVQIIRLHKAGGGMGLSIVAAKGAGQERLGIYIKSVVPGGAADRDGRLAAGDQLLSVDGQSLLGITQEKAAEFLQRTSSVVTLEVAKAGAVYHGLATLLQQPSPQPHRAVDYHTHNYPYGARESSYNPPSYRIFTPPATKPKNNIFFHSDDNLFKAEKHRFTIPRIEIVSDEPVFNLQVTDFSEPSPKNVTLTYDETGINMKQGKIEEFCAKPSNKNWKDKTNDFVQQKSYSIEGNGVCWDISDINERDKFLSIGARKSRQQRLASTSLQELSSSTSSVSSCVHESNLDLSQLDPDTPSKQKTWRSPYEIRLGKVKDLANQFENKAISVPVLNKKIYAKSRSKSVSEEKLNDKLTEFERSEIFKLLQDWSLNGSESKSELNLNLSSENIDKQSRDCEFAEKASLEQSQKCSLRRSKVNFSSEPNLARKQRDSNLIVIAKFRSDNSLSQNVNLDQFNHKCQYRNCIFNVEFVPKCGTKQDDLIGDKTKQKPKGILRTTKNTTDGVECLNNITNLQKKPKYVRRFSEFIETKPFNSHLVRCDSLDRLTDINKKHKKFPDSYIVSRKNSARKYSIKNDENIIKSPKIVVMRRKCLPKTWKSCSDIKTKKTIRKCCRNAKVTCPVSRDSPKVSRKTMSCACIEREQIPQKGEAVSQRCTDSAARLAAFKGAFDRPRRMSERDLPSRIDSEQRSAIPSSKSVPALHQIHSPTTPDHPVSSSSSSNRPPGPEVYPGGTRTLSSTNIERNGQPLMSSLRSSRSTHNLHQQQDAGFYQNLSVYRNKVPSPQQLGDRTSALRSSQNSLHSSVIANSQRPSSAYYPPPNANSASRPNNLHQSIPNLKSSPSTNRLHNEDIHQSIPNLKTADGRTSGSYPNVQYVQQNYYPQYVRQQQQTQQNNFPSPEEMKMGYSNPYGGSNQPYPSPNQNYPSNVQQPLHINPNSRQDERQDIRYNNVGGGLLREDVFRQSQNSRHDEMMRYPSQNNVRISEAHIQNNDLSRHNEMRTSKSEDALRHLAQGEMMRYASSGNIRDNPRIEVAQSSRIHEQQRPANEDRHLRGAAKLAEMSEEVRRRQNRVQHGQQPTQFPQAMNRGDYYHQQQQQQQHYYNHVMSHNAQSMQNLNLNQHQMAYNQQSNQYSPSLTSPTYKVAGMAPKLNKKEDVPLPDLPPVSTHPLYSASSQDPPKMAYYPSNTVNSTKMPRDPWTREEQERQQEARREAARQWQEQQIRELSALPYRTPQQEEQLRVLKLEREFQRRALEAAEEDGDDDTEKESPSPPTPTPQPVSSQTVISTLNSTTVSSKHEPSQIPPASILKPGSGSTPNQNQSQQSSQGSAQPNQVQHSQNQVQSNQNQIQHNQNQMHHNHSQNHLQPNQNHLQQSQNQLQQSQNQFQQNQNQIQHNHIQNQQHTHNQPPSPTETNSAPPAPPERGSSFAVMSMRVKESKRVSFNDAGQQQQQQQMQPPHSQSQQQQQPPNTLALDESIREDPNSFIRQAESMLASPVTPTDASPGGTAMTTPGVIGAQEVYRDPRARRLAEQAQKKDQLQNVPEKLSFKEKMKMFAMETGEQETPKDKSKISRAQREIDNLGSPQQSSGMVH